MPGCFACDMQWQMFVSDATLRQQLEQSFSKTANFIRNT